MKSLFRYLFPVFMFLILIPVFLWASVLSCRALPLGNSRDTNPLMAPGLDPGFHSRSSQTTPGIDDPRLLEVRRLARQGKYAAAEKAVQAFLRTHPESSPAYEILGALQAQQDRLDEGLQNLAKAIALDPGNCSAVAKTGDIYSAQGREDKALEAFRKVLSLDPDNRYAHCRLGALYEKSSIAKAVRHYEKGLKNTPSDYLGAKPDLARLYNLQHRYHETIALLEPALKPESRNLTGLIALGTAYLYSGKNQKALACFNRAREIEPCRGAIALGIALREKGDAREALTVLSRVQAQGKDSAILSYQIAETQLRLQDYDAARRNFRKAIESGYPEIAAMRRLAAVFVAQKKISEAAGIYRKIISSEKADPRDYAALGELYQVAGQLKEAEKIFSELVAKYPDRAASWCRQGLFYGFVKRYDDAIKAFGAALDLHKDYRPAIKGLAVAYRQSGALEKAVATAWRLVELDPENIEDTFFYASLLQDDDRKGEAVKLYRKILARKPDHVLALNNLAALISADGDNAKALPYAERAAGLAPENGRVLDTLGWIQYKLGLTKEALATLEKAVAAAPGVPVLSYHLGVVCKALGRLSAAREYLERSLELSREGSRGSFPQRQATEELLRKL